MTEEQQQSAQKAQKFREGLLAKHRLESYCFNMKTIMDDEKISADDKKLIADKCDDAINWLDANQLAEVEEFAEKQKELEAVCNPIITKLYESAGGAPGGGMPGAGGAGGASSGGSGSGPTMD